MSFARNATAVLVHGAWADGSCWRNVILPLQKEGLKVTCAPIPLTSLTEDITALERVIERTSGPVLLAGHAYAGAVIAGAKDDRVKSLVYVAALAPAEGETVADVFYRAKPHPEAPHLEPDVHGLIWMPEGGFARAVAHLALADQTTILEAVQRPIALKCIQEKASCTSVENEAIVVSVSARGSHDCAGDAMLYGRPDGREDSHTPGRSQSDVFGARCRCGRDSGSGTGDVGMLKSVAIVTGASQGIGRATAVRLARDFEAVVLAARQADELNKTAAAVKSAGAEPLSYALDLRESCSADTLVQGTLDRFGRIDALLNIAGAVPQIDLFEMTDAQWEDGLALKLHAARRMTIRAWDALKASQRRCGADLRKRGSGSEAWLRGGSHRQRRHHCAREGLCRARHPGWSPGEQRSAGSRL